MFSLSSWEDGKEWTRCSFLHSPSPRCPSFNIPTIQVDIYSLCIINGGPLSMGGPFPSLHGQIWEEVFKSVAASSSIRRGLYWSLANTSKKINVFACMGRNINEWTQDVSLNSPSPQQCQHITARSALWLTKCTVPVAGVALPFDCVFY